MLEVSGRRFRAHAIGGDVAYQRGFRCQNLPGTECFATTVYFYS